VLYCAATLSIGPDVTHLLASGRGRKDVQGRPAQVLYLTTVSIVLAVRTARRPLLVALQSEARSRPDQPRPMPTTLSSCLVANRAPTTCPRHSDLPIIILPLQDPSPASTSEMNPHVLTLR